MGKGMTLVGVVVAAGVSITTLWPIPRGVRWSSGLRGPAKPCQSEEGPSLLSRDPRSMLTTQRLLHHVRHYTAILTRGYIVNHCRMTNVPI